MNSHTVSRLFGLLTLCCCALSACDRNTEPAQTQVQTPAVMPTSATKSSANTSAAGPLAGMVKAVASDTHQQAIELRFELAGRPEVGRAMDIKLNLLAVDDAADVKVTISADPKLIIVAGADAAFATIKAGESVGHTVTVRGADAGIFVVDAKLTATANGGPRTMNYAVPVAIVSAVSVAGDPAAAAPK